MDFPSNSHNVLGELKAPKAEKPPKDVQKVVVGEVVQRKKPLGRRMKAIFFGGEFKGATKYVVADVLIPAFRNMIVDATSKGVERVVYPDSPRRRYDSIRPPRVSYNSPYDRYSQQERGRSRVMLPDQPPRDVPSSNRRQDSGEIIFVSRDEADRVAERLTDIVDKYEVASVADLHGLVGLPANYVDNKWGWSSLRGVDIRQVREGFLLDLPPVEPI